MFDYKRFIEENIFVTFDSETEFNEFAQIMRPHSSNFEYSYMTSRALDAYVYNYEEKGLGWAPTNIIGHGSIQFCRSKAGFSIMKYSELQTNFDIDTSTLMELIG